MMTDVGAVLWKIVEEKKVALFSCSPTKWLFNWWEAYSEDDTSHNALHNDSYCDFLIPFN